MFLENIKKILFLFFKLKLIKLFKKLILNKNYYLNNK